MESSVVELMNTLGFPIVVVLGLAWWVNKTLEQNRVDDKEDKEKLYEIISETREANAILLETNKLLAGELSATVKSVDKKIDELIRK